jgi:hypothetical protein
MAIILGTLQFGLPLHFLETPFGKGFMKLKQVFQILARKSKDGQAGLVV